VLAPRVSTVRGHCPSGSTSTNGSSAYAATHAARTAAAPTPGRTRAVQVARIPRGIGASAGVNETLTGRPAAAVRFCSISGVCR